MKVKHLIWAYYLPDTILHLLNILYSSLRGRKCYYYLHYIDREKRHKCEATCLRSHLKAEPKGGGVGGQQSGSRA